MKTKQLLKTLSYTPKRSHWLVFASVLLICTVLAFFTDIAREMFRYQNDISSTSQYWRLLTGHVVHLGWSHFVLNMAGFFVLWLLYGGMYTARQWLCILIFSAVGISLGFVFFDTNLSWYVGLSGVLHTIFAATMCALLLHSLASKSIKLQWEDVLLMFFLTGKLIYEQWIGPVPFTESGSGGPVVVNAHLYGAIMGCICSVFLFKFTHFNSSNKEKG